MQQQEGYDMIVCGLGVVGLFVSYLGAKQGKRVIAFERHEDSGVQTAQSACTTYLWYKEEGIDEALKEWKAVEKESGETILHPTGGIDIRGEPNFSNASEDAAKKYPGLRVEGDNWNWEEQMGIFYEPAALGALKVLAQKHGATLDYNTKIKDYKKGSVTLEDGTVIEAKSIVISTGGKGFLDKFGLKHLNIMSLHSSSAEGLPPVILDWTQKGVLYGHQDGLELKGYQVGTMNQVSEKELRDMVSSRLPKFEAVKLHSWLCLRDKDGKIVDVCELDKESGLIYCFGAPFSICPLFASKILGMAA